MITSFFITTKDFFKSEFKGLCSFEDNILISRIYLCGLENDLRAKVKLTLMFNDHNSGCFI